MTPETFWRNVDLGPDGECWLWTGRLRDDGYAQAWVTGFGAGQVHRHAYRLSVGPIPEGLELDHLCRVRHCVNPAHLEPVTPRENTLRSEAWTAVNARKTHCPAGHPYDEANTRRIPSRPTARYCRACAAEHQRRYRSKAS